MAMVYYRAEKECPFTYEQVQQILSLEIESAVPEIIMEDSLPAYQKRMQSATQAFRFAVAAISTETTVKNPRTYINLEIKAEQLESSYLGLLRPGPGALKLNQASFIQYIQHLEFLLSKLPEKDLLNTSPANWLAKADEYAILIQPKPPLVTVSRLDGVSSEQYLLQMETPQSPMNKSVLQQYLDTQSPEEDKHPRWYAIMKPYEKILFNQAIQRVLQGESKGRDLEKLQSNIQAISSRLRSVPGLPNFSIHRAFIIDKAANVLAELPADVRSSVVSSRDHQETLFDFGNEKLVLRREFTKDNIALIIENFIEKHDFGKEAQAVTDDDIEQLLIRTPILLQTLISPQAPSAMKPDAELFADKNAVIDALKNQGLVLNCLGRQCNIPGTSLNLFYTNHPLNPARHVAQTVHQREIGSSTTTPPAMDALIDFGKKHIKIDMDTELVKAVLLALEKEKAAPYRLTIHSIADKNHHRELYLAALELLLTSLLDGIAHSTCVSGKDRRAILAIFKDSMSVYIHNYRKIKNFNQHFFDKMLKDPNFIKIFVSIYTSGHHQANAAQSAPGAEGIKTPHLYLPQNISRVIGKKRIVQDDLLAGNNEFNKLLAKRPNNPARQTLRGAAIGFFSGLLLTVLVLTAIVFLGYFSLLTVGIVPLLIAVGIGGACTSLGWSFVGGLLGHEIESTTDEDRWIAIERKAALKFDSDYQVRQMLLRLGPAIQEEKQTDPEVPRPEIREELNPAAEAFCAWILSHYHLFIIEDDFPTMLSILIEKGLKGLVGEVQRSHSPYREEWLREIRNYLVEREAQAEEKRLPMLSD